MRILYAAKHWNETQSNDDEGAIAHALRVLGHSVTLVQETQDPSNLSNLGEHDFMLVHKPDTDCEWFDYAEGRMPRVCWYFDRVADDKETRGRSRSRQQWMNSVMGKLDFLFCTDGDWVSQCQLSSVNASCRTHWLPQGADERWWKFDVKPNPEYAGKLLLTASLGNAPRVNFYNYLIRSFGKRVVHVSHGLYRHKFMAACQGAAGVIAPNTPVSQVYWSNRVYGVLAAGGFLFHSGEAGLLRAGHYEPGDFETYSDLANLVSRIEHATSLPESKRKERAELARQRTWERNLYRHRLVDLLDIISR